MAKLAHQPFEDWMLMGVALEPEQELELKAHLQTCVLCARLNNALLDIDRELRSTPQVEPANGFALRWEARRVADHQRMQRVQTFMILLFSIGGASLLLVLSLWLILPIFRAPLPVLLTPIYDLVRVYWLSSTVGEALAALIKTLFGLIPITMWISIAVATCGLCIVWVAALYRLTTTRRLSI